MCDAAWVRMLTTCSTAAHARWVLNRPCSHSWKRAPCYYARAGFRARNSNRFLVPSIRPRLRKASLTPRLECIRGTTVRELLYSWFQMESCPRGAESIYSTLARGTEPELKCFRCRIPQAITPPAFIARSMKRTTRMPIGSRLICLPRRLNGRLCMTVCGARRSAISVYCTNPKTYKLLLVPT